MVTWYRVHAMNWFPAVAVLALLGLPGAIQAQPVNVVVQAPGAGEQEMTVLDETVAGESFEDPFDAAAHESVRDPWEPFNTEILEFNHWVDIYLMRPAARAYSGILPPDVQHSIAQAFDNLGFAPRLLNNLFQGKFTGAGRETQRFLLNSTLGVGGFFDVATHVFEIESPPAEDVGQTLAVYGVRSGPYLILPMFPPMTVRDVTGYVGGIVLNPVNFFIPFLPNLGVNATQRINDRSLNLKTFEDIEASTLDLYGAIRSGYFERRAKDIRE